MKRPGMILFDYGHTLVWEKSYDAEKGFDALLAHAVKNPLRADAAQITETYRRLQRPVVRDVVSLDYEMPACAYDRAVYDLLGLEFDIPEDECQCVVWDASCPMEAMPGIRRFLDRVTAAGIRVGLVSNLAFSEYALRHRIKKATGFDEWELVVASSTYGFRKPSPVLFEIARRKAGLPAEDILFCGDNTYADIGGASAAGMRPVWYNCPIPCFYKPEEHSRKPDVPHIEISHWDELAEMLGI